MCSAAFSVDSVGVSQHCFMLRCDSGEGQPSLWADLVLLPYGMGGKAIINQE